MAGKERASRGFRARFFRLLELAAAHRGIEFAALAHDGSAAVAPALHGAGHYVLGSCRSVRHRKINPQIKPISQDGMQVRYTQRYLPLVHLSLYFRCRRR